MYADVVVSGGVGASGPVIPRSAVQNVGAGTVVYLASLNEPGAFVEREVRLGQSSGDQVEVIAGLQAGDLIVTEGSFSIRAERERLGVRAGSAAAPTPAEPVVSERGRQPVQSARIAVTEQGFEPATVTLRAGTPARLVFTRVTDQTCGTEIVFPSLGLRRALPLNEPVAIEFTPATTGDMAFACGMNMLHGIAVVE
jgi:hypothetical protein